MELSKYLSKYFSLNGQVTIPGLGELSVIRIPSTNDFANKLFYPPLFRYRFENNLAAPPENLLNYLRKKLKVSDDTLQEQLTQFGEEVNAQIHSQGKLEWEGIGKFTLDEKNNVLFSPLNNQISYSEEIKYVHVVRDQFTHDVMSGDNVQSIEELNKYIEEQKQYQSRQYWKTTSLVICVVAIAILIARYMMGSFTFFEPRHNPIKAKDSSATYFLKN